MTPITAELTDRQEHVVRLLAEGLEERGIARELGITVYGVRYLVDEARRRTGALNRPHLVALYLQRRGEPA